MLKGTVLLCPRADSVYNPGYDPLPQFSPQLKFAYAYFSFEYILDDTQDAYQHICSEKDCALS